MRLGSAGGRDEEASSRDDNIGAGFPVPSVDEMNTESNLLSNLMGDFRPLEVDGATDDE